MSGALNPPPLGEGDRPQAVERAVRERRSKGCKRPIHIRKNKLCSQSKSSNTPHCEPGVAPLVTLGAILGPMAIAVDFNGKLRRVAVKVEDVGPDRMLAANP